MEKAIVGGGAVGLLTAAYMILNEQDVTIYTRRREQADLLNREGLILKRGTEKQIISVRANVFNSDIREQELILAVKQYHLDGVMEQVLRYIRPKNILFLQNGMAHLNYLNDIPSYTNVLLGVVEHGALKVSDNCVEHTGVGQIRVSSPSNHMETAAELLQVKDPNFPYVYEEDWYGMLADKLAANAVINSLTSLYRIKNGELLTRREFRSVMWDVYVEVADTLQLKERDKTWKQIQRICETTAHNTSSMQKDLQNGRKTEVEAIIGWLIEQAEMTERNIPLLLFLYRSLKGLEGNGGA